MSTWYSVSLGNGIEAYTPSLKIQEFFLPIFANANMPYDMAVFSRHDIDKNIVMAYFSPSADSIAKIFKAIPCEKPSRDNLGLLAGDMRCWDILF